MTYAASSKSASGKAFDMQGVHKMTAPLFIPNRRFPKATGNFKKAAKNFKKSPGNPKKSSKESQNQQGIPKAAGNFKKTSGKIQKHQTHHGQAIPVPGYHRV
ncbi:MAG: hypothetical protein NC121_12825 [Blautia sp.]|nr:hypothetical protein [Blautia sp.]